MQCNTDLLETLLLCSITLLLISIVCLSVVVCLHSLAFISLSNSHERPNLSCLILGYGSGSKGLTRGFIRPCHFDEQGRKSSVTVYYYPLF